MSMYRSHELPYLRRALQHCRGAYEVYEVVEALVATADPRALPVLETASHEYLGDQLRAFVVDGMVAFGGDAIEFARRRLARACRDQSTMGKAEYRVRRFLPLLLLARLGDRSAMRELIAEHMDYGRTPMTTSAQLLRCGREGIEEIVRIEEPKKQVRAAFMLARARRRTEATLLEMVSGATRPNLVALQALAFMPSAKAEPVFMRVLMDPEREGDERLRKIAEKGLLRLVAPTAEEVASLEKLDQPAEAEAKALRRTTQAIRAEITAAPRDEIRDEAVDADPFVA